MGDVFADAADVGVVFADGVDGEGVELGGGVVLYDDARGLGEQFAGFVGGQLFLGFDVDRFAVAGVDGDADGGGGDADGVVAHDFHGLIYHFHFFAGVAVVAEGVAAGDLGDAVEGDGVGEFVAFQVGLAGEDGPGLLVEFVQGGTTGAGDGLVGGDDDAFNCGGGVEGLKYDDHLDGGAVGVCDDAFVFGDVLGVDFGDDEGDFGVHAPSAGIVHDDAAVFGCEGGEFLAGASAGAEEGDVDAFEGVLGEDFDFEFFAFEGQLLAFGAFRGEEFEGGDGEIAIFEGVQHLATDNTCRAGDGDNFSTHGIGSVGFGLGFRAGAFVFTMAYAYWSARAEGIADGTG